MAIKTEGEFIELVNKAEAESQQNPQWYLFKLALFASLGYAVILTAVISLLGIVGGLVAIAFLNFGFLLLLLKKKIIFFLLAGVWILIQALRVPFTPPQGYVLRREAHPELFAELDDLTKTLDSLEIHEVILRNELNAAVVQSPRLGILGWQKNHLIIGYQLMLILSKEEFRAVLAHELGHLSGNHSGFHNWIYRVRLTWLRVMSSFDDVDSWGGIIMGRFFRWYSPKFDAYSFALARRNEYEADAISAELTSAEVASKALVNVYATAPYLNQRYWDSYFKSADTQKKPPHPPLNGLVRFIQESPITREDMLKHIKDEMAISTHYSDTHPCLKERIDALNAAPQLPQVPDVSAAEALLNGNDDDFIQMFDNEWYANNKDAWSNRYEYCTDARAHLEKFKNADLSDLSNDDLWKLAYWTMEFESNELAQPFFQRYQKRFPSDPDAAFYIGLDLFHKKDPACLEKFRLAFESYDRLEAAARYGYNFLENQGRQEEAESWWADFLRKDEIFQEAHQERQSVTDDDSFMPPKMEADVEQELIRNLKASRKVAHAWLAEKAVSHYPESPVYIVAFKEKGWHFSVNKLVSTVAKSLKVNEDIFLACLAGDQKPLAKKVQKAGRQLF